MKTKLKLKSIVTHIYYSKIIVKNLTDSNLASFCIYNQAIYNTLLNVSDFSRFLSSLCTNGGHCLTALNSYICQCPTGHGGINCEIGRLLLLQMHVGIINMRLSSLVGIPWKHE